MAQISHKLSNAFEGALAGGGDPATSPLYVFGPFLRLIVVAGVAKITFGASIWMVVITVALVSAMYRLVMIWVIDGSGGSGLSEEEFGSWAVKVNAGITFVEYTLTFLVSMAALVTFIADRFPVLNEPFLGRQYRTFVAIFFSIGTAWLVNRGPKMAAKAFGPATAGVLLLMWAMIISTIWNYGLRLPSLNLEAFSSEHIKYTIGGYARILALMTGIEIFANLVAAYDGTPAQKSRKAFQSLLIIMGTTSLTMLVVGPAIADLSDPTNTEVSVFTQTMDQLLPEPLALLGTIVGVAVLLSASAASAQGLQNLALGLKLRRYIPAYLGRRNIYDVADKPVWIEAGIVSVCFLIIGTNEETYLAIYAAGVFILLSMTGWAATKRLLRFIRDRFEWRTALSLVATIAAALLTTGATLIIFSERFSEGAWSYFLLLPGLYILFSYFRSRLGKPTPFEERLGLLVKETQHLPFSEMVTRAGREVSLSKVMISLDGTSFAEEALPAAKMLCRVNGASLTIISIEDEQKKKARIKAAAKKNSRFQNSVRQAEVQSFTDYLSGIAQELERADIRVDAVISKGMPVEEISRQASDRAIDVLVMSTRGRKGVGRLLRGSVVDEVTTKTEIPTVMVRPNGNRSAPEQSFGKLLVPMDGSRASERILPYVKMLAGTYDSEVVLLSVPEDLESPNQLEFIEHYLRTVADTLNGQGLRAKFIISGTDPIQKIIEVAAEESVDMIMLATHGRGGLDRVMLGSVADTVINAARCPVFVVPDHKPR